MEAVLEALAISNFLFAIANVLAMIVIWRIKHV